MTIYILYSKNRERERERYLDIYVYTVAIGNSQSNKTSGKLPENLGTPTMEGMTKDPEGRCLLENSLTNHNGPMPELLIIINATWGDDCIRTNKFHGDPKWRLLKCKTRSFAKRKQRRTHIKV